MADRRERQSKRTAKKCAEISRILVREEVRAQTKRVSNILCIKRRNIMRMYRFCVCLELRNVVPLPGMKNVARF